MPVIINKQTGVAENVPDDISAQQALASGTHEIPLVSPDGTPGTAPADAAPELLQQGYKQPSTGQLGAMLKKAKFGTTSEQIKTALEGAASASTFGLSTQIQKNLGANPEDILARREENPGSHMLGQMAGLGVGMLTGSGEAAILEKLGAGVAAKASAAMAPGAASRIGSQAAKAVTENMLFQMGDEASKAFVSDPNQSVQSAITEVGLAGVLGGAFGAGLGSAGELWKIGPGKNLESLMTAMKNKSSGLPSELKTAANIDIAPEVEAALGGGEYAKKAADALMDSGSNRGDKFRSKVGEFHDNVNKALPEALGRTEDDILNIVNESKYEAGKQVQDTLSKALDERIKPISEQYEKFNERFKSAVLNESDKTDIANKVADLINTEGLGKGPNEGALKLANKVLEQLPMQESAQDLRKYVQGLYSAAPFGSEAYQVGKQIRSILNNANESVVSRMAADAGADTFSAFERTQKEYSSFKGLLEELNDRLHVGREGKSGAGGFIGALKSMEPEKVMQRLNLKNDVSLQTMLSNTFPEVAELAKKQELNNLIRKSMHASGERLDAKKLFKQIDALSPELRSYLINSDSSARLQAIKELVNRAPTGINTSKTATALDKMWKHVPASAGGMAGLLLGKSAIAGWLLGEASHWVGREAPDAVRLAMLKFIGSGESISGPGFKAAVEMASATLKGEAKMNKAVKAVFKAGSMPAIASVTQQDRDKLDKQISHLMANQEDAMGIGGHTGHYLPDHGAAMGLASARAVSYLASLKPDTTPKNPLDKPRVLSAVEKGNYNRALDIAQNPAVVLEDIKNGTLNQLDVKHLRSMYPELYANMANKLNQQMIDAVHNGTEIPYKTKQSLSLFLGQALDSSFTQQSIASNQMAQMQQMPAPPQNAGTKNGTTRNNPHLADLGKSMLTPNQERQMHKTRQH